MVKFICTGLVALMFFIFLLASFTCWETRNKIKEELKRLKSEEKVRVQYLAQTSGEENNAAKSELERITSELERITSRIKFQKTHSGYLRTFSIEFLVAAIMVPIIASLLHVFLQYVLHYPDFEGAKQLCGFLWLYSELFPSTSQNSVNQADRELNVIYDPAAQQSRIFRRTRNRKDDSVQESAADLPGVPSTSND